MVAHGESVWKLALGVALLLGFFVTGVAHVVKPDYFIQRSAVRKGGEMLTEWNRLTFQIGGLLLAGFSVGILYEIGKDILVTLKPR